MNQRNRITSELDRQAQHEGETDNIRQCRVILRHAQTSADWQSMVTVSFHRYGPMSFEAHRFYYVRDWMIPMATELLAVTNIR